MSLEQHIPIYEEHSNGRQRRPWIKILGVSQTADFAVLLKGSFSTGNYYGLGDHTEWLGVDTLTQQQGRKILFEGEFLHPRALGLRRRYNDFDSLRKALMQKQRDLMPPEERGMSVDDLRKLMG